MTWVFVSISAFLVIMAFFLLARLAAVVSAFDELMSRFIETNQVFYTGQKAIVKRQQDSIRQIQLTSEVVKEIRSALNSISGLQQSLNLVADQMSKFRGEKWVSPKLPKMVTPPVPVPPPVRRGTKADTRRKQ